MNKSFTALAMLALAMSLMLPTAKAANLDDAGGVEAEHAHFPELEADAAAGREVAAVVRQPAMRRPWVNGQPCGIATIGSAMLGLNSALVMPLRDRLLPSVHDHGLRKDPAVRVVWTYPQADREFVVLVPKLLKSICSRLPQRAELDFDAMPVDQSIRVRIG